MGIIPEYFSQMTGPDPQQPSAARLGKDRFGAHSSHSWAPLGEGINRKPGVNILCVYEDKLIAAGAFDSAGTVPAQNIAVWDGSSWAAMDSGYEGTRVFSIYHDTLYAAGIRYWNGAGWVSAGVDISSVYSMTVHDDKLIVGGFFETVGGDTVNNIVAYDGTDWHPLGDGFYGLYTSSNPQVNSLLSYNGD